MVSPDELCEKHGADTLRLYTLFVGPPQLDAEWSDRGIMGAEGPIRRGFGLFGFGGQGSAFDTVYYQVTLSTGEVLIPEGQGLLFCMGAQWNGHVYIKQTIEAPADTFLVFIRLRRPKPKLPGECQ